MPPSSDTPGAAPSIPATGLLLTGGGARAAYQVGVLEAIADLRLACGEGDGPNPFPIITGTSAGAINAAALACGADHFDRAVRRIARVWRQFHASQVYGADSLSVMRSGARWLTLVSLGWALARWRRMRPKSLLDNTPLEKLLVKMVPLVRLPRLIRKGHLTALAVTASSYSSGEHVTFFEAATPVKPWVRSQRKAASDRITHEHLLASSAIPFIFPAKGIEVDDHIEYFGDGSMRQSAPIAPAIHLGAERILVIGAGRMHEPKGDAAAKILKAKTAVVGYTDFPAGKDSLAAFKQAFEAAGGKVIDEIPMGGPAAVPDLTPFFQRAKDKKPDVFLVFVPAGDHAAAVVKTYGALGMRAAGIKLIGPGDITQDTKLQGMGEAAVGLITMHHYNADLDNPENKRFVAAWKQAYGKNSVPDFMAVGGYDGMAAIVHVVRTLKGKIDTDKGLEALKGWKYNSPRGPIMIDGATRDIIMSEYLSEVVMKDGRLFQKTIGKIDNVKDACKELKIGPCAPK